MSLSQGNHDEDGGLMGTSAGSRDVAALKLAEHARLIIENRLSCVVESSPVVMLAFDAAGVVTFAEGRDLRHFGRPVAALVGLQLADLARQVPDAADAVTRALAGEASEVAVNFRGRHYDFRYRPESDENGRIVGAFSVGTDVTERVEAVEQAQEREARWETLLSQSADVAVIGDSGSGLINYVSPAVTRLFGWAPSQLCGRHAMSLVHPEDFERVARALAAVADPGQHTTVEFRLACADGSYRWVEETISNLNMVRGIAGFVANIRDISDRVDAADAAAQREARWGAIVSQSADVALIADVTTTAITYASPAVTRLFGWRPEELVGRIGIELVHPADLERVTAALQMLVEDSSKHVTIEFRFLSADGAYRWVEQTISNLEAVPGVHGLVGNLRDITDRRAAEEQLRRRDRVTRALAAKASDVALVVGIDGRVRYLNPSASTVVVASEGDTLDFEGLGYVHPDDRTLVREALGSLAVADATAQITYRRRGVDGGWRWVEQVVTNCVDDSDIQGFVVNVREITDQVVAQTALNDSEGRYRLIAETAQEGIWATDLRGQTLFANQKMADLLGLTLSCFYDRPVWDLVTGSTRQSYPNGLRRGEKKGPEEYDIEHTRPDGSERILHVSVSPFLEGGRRLGSLAMLSDTTDAHQAEDDLRHRASHDPLTGLANRALLLDCLQKALDRSHGSVPKAVSLLVADIDQFKLVNDSFGHASGDDLLMEVSRRWQAELGPDQLCARFGGDEFVVLCRGAGEEAAKEVAARLLQALETPVLLAGRPVAASASIGIAVADVGDALDAETLVRYADAAMYDAKARGRSRTEVFSPCLIERAQSQLQLFNDLKSAINNDELALHYQPIVQLATGDLLGVEALCRWNHPQRGAVAPDEFIKAAESGGLIEALDRWVLRRACGDGAALRAAGILPLDAYLSVNTSAASLAGPRYEEGVQAALSESALPAAALVLEVTESAVMTDPDAARRVLESLRSLGVRIAVDDFGTGYSSLAYLRRLPVGTLKIDRGFVTHVSEDADDRAIVAAVIDLANALTVTTTAEGIETTADLALLQQLGCHAGQGFLWSPALPPDRLAELIRRLPQGRFAVAPHPKPHSPRLLPLPRTRNTTMPNGGVGAPEADLFCVGDAAG